MLNSIQSAGLPGSKIPSQVGGLISLFLPYIFYGSGIGLLIYLVIGGFQLMTSRGDPKGIQAAQAKITNALVGFLIIIFSFILVSLIGKVLGISAFGLIFGGGSSVPVI